MKMRLDRFLSNNGFGSRKEVKELIKEKRVCINDDYKVKNDSSFDPEKEIVKVDGGPIEYHEFYYFLLNKPKGYLSATEDNFQSTVMDLLPEYSYLSLFPVGRLDKDTTGALMITNDGALAHQLLSPKRHVDKVYLATVDKELKESLVSGFEKGIIMDEELTLPADLKILSPHQAEVILRQGKYHQVKRMFEHFGYTVTDLHREKFAFLTVEDLAEGEFRELTESEVKQLKNL